MIHMIRALGAPAWMFTQKKFQAIGYVDPADVTRSSRKRKLQQTAEEEREDAEAAAALEGE